MAKALISDELWSLIAAHLPAHPPSPKGGRPQIGDRATLTGILFVLRTGIPWEYLPRELGCGSGMTRWRRLHEWTQAGVWQSVHEAILRRLREYDQIAWDRACIDAASVPSPRGGEHTGRNPTDRGKLWLQTPHSGRSAWPAVGSPDIRCASSRFPVARAARRGNPGRQRVVRPGS
jgi:transposase